jgi:hypothetical protein
MKPEQPAEGIMKTGEFGDSKFYKVVCTCGQPDHDIDFEVEACDTGINVNTYVTAKSDYWTSAVEKRYDIDNPWLQEWDWFWKDLVNGIVTRVKLTWIIWTKGHVQVETTIAMNKQQALNYAETLKSAVKDVEQFCSASKSNAINQQVLKEANEQDCV